MLQRPQQLYPDSIFDFVQGINANRRLRIYISELNEELLAFTQGQPRRLLPCFFSGLVDINDRLQEFVFRFLLGKLLNKRVQNALGLSAIFLGSIAVEVRYLLGRRNEKIDGS